MIVCFLCDGEVTLWLQRWLTNQSKNPRGFNHNKRSDSVSSPTKTPNLNQNLFISLGLNQNLDLDLSLNQNQNLDLNLNPSLNMSPNQNHNQRQNLDLSLGLCQNLELTQPQT